MKCWYKHDKIEIGNNNKKQEIVDKIMKWWNNLQRLKANIDYFFKNYHNDKIKNKKVTVSDNYCTYFVTCDFLPDSRTHV